MVDGWIIFAALLAAYLLIVYVLVRAGMLNRLNISLFLGIALMVRTKRGQGLLNWFASARVFFDWFARVGLWITVVAMVGMTLLLLVQLPFVFQIPAESVPSPSLILGIPGINPIIPLWYGIVGLVFAVVVHEFSHGILARVYDLKVKSMGLLFLIVPIGAFVEPDEEELRAAPRRHRMRVFSAGPLANLVFAVLFAAAFSATIDAGTDPVPGIPIQGVEAGGPLDGAGVEAGWIITHLDGTPTPCLADLQTLMGDTENDIRPNTTVRLSMLETPAGPQREVVVTTVRRAELFTDDQARAAFETNPKIANDTVIGFLPYGACGFHAVMAQPFSSGGALLAFVSLPFFILRGTFPLSEPFNTFFATPEMMPVALFWVAANTLYWLFWLNLMLGLTNALPLVPLDGGHMFRDFVGGFLERRRPNQDPAARDRIVNRAAGWMAFLLLALIAVQFIGPGIAASFR